MEIGQKFNILTKEAYFFFIDNHKKYSDFNTLGLYRSIIENGNLTLLDKIEVRDYAHRTFQKTFDFLQLKDPKTYFEVSVIGQEITKGDEEQIWYNIRANQQKILADKKIKHRNFGDYSKHNCGFDNCPYNGLMIKQGSWLEEGSMHFKSDKNKYPRQVKSERLKRKGKKYSRQLRRSSRSNNANSQQLLSKSIADNPHLCSSNSYHLLLSADNTLLNICNYLQLMFFN